MPKTSKVEVFHPNNIKIQKDTIPELLQGRYKLIKKISITTMSKVYKAIDIKENKTVAIKVVDVENMNQKNRLRWEREVRILKLWMNTENDKSRKYLVKITDIFDYNGHSCLVMPFMKNSLKELIKEEGKISIAKGMNIFLDICKGVEIYHNWEFSYKKLQGEAPDPGIIHRDIKPQNILFDEFNSPKILDVGISVFRDKRIDNEINKEIVKELHLDEFDEENPHPTSEGNIVGSVQYIDPEVSVKQRKNNMPQSDIYSLGVTLFEMLTGKVPFTGNSIADVAAKHSHQTVPLLRDELHTTVPFVIENIITKCTAKGNEFLTLRYKNIEELISDIENYTSGRSLTEKEQLITCARTRKKSLEKHDVLDITTEKRKVPMYFSPFVLCILWLIVITCLTIVLVI